MQEYIAKISNKLEHSHFSRLINSIHSIAATNKDRKKERKCKKNEWMWKIEDLHSISHGPANLENIIVHGSKCHVKALKQHQLTSRIIINSTTKHKRNLSVFRYNLARTSNPTVKLIHKEAIFQPQRSEPREKDSSLRDHWHENFTCDYDPRFSRPQKNVAVKSNEQTMSHSHG